jgi:hypothetical protein
MKHFSSILLATLVSAALMQLFCAHLELKYTREALAWELKSEADLLNMSNERTRRQAEKTARLETKLKALTAGKTQSTNSGSNPAALF